MTDTTPKTQEISFTVILTIDGSVNKIDVSALGGKDEVLTVSGVDGSITISPSTLNKLVGTVTHMRHMVQVEILEAVQREGLKNMNPYVQHQLGGHAQMLARQFMGSGTE